MDKVDRDENDIIDELYAKVVREIDGDYYWNGDYKLTSGDMYILSENPDMSALDERRKVKYEKMKELYNEKKIVLSDSEKIEAMYEKYLYKNGLDRKDKTNDDIIEDELILGRISKEKLSFTMQKKYDQLLNFLTRERNAIPSELGAEQIEPVIVKKPADMKGIILIILAPVVLILFAVQVVGFIYAILCTISLLWIISIEIKEQKINIFLRIIRVLCRSIIGPYYIYKHKIIYGTFLPFRYS